MLGQLTQERLHLRGTKRAVQPYREDIVGADAGEESIECLPTQSTPCQITHRYREHNWQFNTFFRHNTINSIDGDFGIQRVEDSFNKQSIYPTRYQCFSLLFICSQQLVVSQISSSRIAHIR